MPQLSEYIIFLRPPLTDHSSITDGNLNAYTFYKKSDNILNTLRSLWYSHYIDVQKVLFDLMLKIKEISGWGIRL